MPHSPEDSEATGLGWDPGIFWFSKAPPLNSAAQATLWSTFLCSLGSFPGLTLQDFNVTQQITEKSKWSQSFTQVLCHALGQDYVSWAENNFTLVTDITRSQQDHTDLSWQRLLGQSVFGLSVSSEVESVIYMVGSKSLMKSLQVNFGSMGTETRKF